MRRSDRFKIDEMRDKSPDPLKKGTKREDLQMVGRL